MAHAANAGDHKARQTVRASFLAVRQARHSSAAPFVSPAEAALNASLRADDRPVRPPVAVGNGNRGGSARSSPGLIGGGRQ